MIGRLRLALGLTLVLAGSASAGDWPFWRGPEQNGTTRENAPVTTWSTDGENMLWRSDMAGRTTPIVMKGRVFFNGPVGEDECRGERVVCLDAATGKLLWEQRFNVFHTDIVENRVGWTALVGDPETGNVYCHGTGGEMFCFSRDGDIVWKWSMTEDFGRISGYGGRLMTPVIDEDRVIISYLSSSWGPLAKPAHRYVAFDKRNGNVLWWAAPGGKPLDTTYCTPAVAVIDGVRMLIGGNADGDVYGMKSRTGETLWSYKLSKRGLNSSIVVDGKYAYVCHSEENYTTTHMGAILCIDASKRGDITENGAVWRKDGYTVGYASPAISKGRLYCVSNNATLYCLDAKTGDQIWEQDLGRVGKGSPVVTADDVIYVGDQTGIFYILRDAGGKCEVLDREDFERDDGLVDEIYGSPAISNGAVYFMTRYSTFCLGPKEICVTTEKIDPMLTQPAGTFSEATLAMTVPAEVTLRPGDDVTFAVKLFDDKQNTLSRPTGDNDAVALNWKVKGVNGEVSPSGKFTASNDAAYSAGVVECEVDGKLTAAARVRIVPDLPIQVDFDSVKADGPVPGWVGLGKKAMVVDLDGKKVLKKSADKQFPSPPFMRMRAYATPPLPAGYTVQVDMMSELKEKRRRSYQPDMGIINDRYYFVLMGGDPKRENPGMMRIESWSALPRLRKDIEFPWKSDTWYTAKFDVHLEGDKAVCRAKVWPRGEKEPADWMIEATDPCPNLEGSAGLYAYSTNTTASSDGPASYFDNFQVTRNSN